MVSAQADAESEVEDFFTEVAANESDLGPAGTILDEAGIFADLDDFSDGYNDLARLQAAYRLNQMGELGDDEYDNLVSRTNNYRAESSLTPITPDIIADIAVPESEWPSELTSERDGLISQRVADYNENPLVEDLSETEVLFDLTSPALSLDQRYDNFNTLYDDPNYTAFMTDDFAEDYLGYLNAERVLSGEELDDLFN